MKNYIVICVLCGLMLPAFGANRSMIAAAPAGNDSVRATAIKNNQFVINNKSNDNVKSSVRKQHGVAVLSAVPVDETPGVSVVDDDPRLADSRILENATKRAACVDNNVGASNTFVWASRNSNTSSYSTMIEDTENPENNVCFVAVSMQSKDSRVNISDIQPRYFAMGDVVNCGSWVDQGVLEKRILDGKKTVRVLSAVGAAVGGAALGVGAMEVFGNNLIGGAVAGQKGLADKAADDETAKSQWYVSKMNELKTKNPDVYDCIVKSVNADTSGKDEVVKILKSNNFEQINENPSCDENWDSLKSSYLDMTANSSKWVNADGGFNTARLVSDSVAGVLLGSAGGVITGVVVKKNQVKKGFEDISCSVGGQILGNYGDDIRISNQ